MTSENVTTCVNLVFLIETTGPMAEYLGHVKKSASEICANALEQCSADHGSDVLFRVDLITFGDLEMGEPLCESGFLDLTEGTAPFDVRVSELTTAGGGDATGTGLDALGYAMMSDWNNGCEHSLDCIFLYSASPSKYPGSASRRDGRFPSTIEDIFTRWENLGTAHVGKLLCVLSPEDTWDVLWNMPDTVIVYLTSGSESQETIGSFTDSALRLLKDFIPQ